MENFSFHVPFYIVNGGIATSGHSADLTPGKVGLFDRQTFSVATPTGNGKEFFFAQGRIGGVDWSGVKVTESHKSPFFMGKDVLDMYKVDPKRIVNEEWVLGYNGAVSSVGLTYQKDVPVRFKFEFNGEPAYRFFNGPKQYTVSHTPDKDCVEACEGGCADDVSDPLQETMKLIDKINNHTELKKFGVQAKLKSSDYAATTPNMEKFQLKICDAGDSVALQTVQSQYPTQNVVRVSRLGNISTYEVCVVSTAGDDTPLAFAQSGSVSLAICGSCASIPGSVLVAAKDVYFITRALAGTEDLSTAELRDTYADTIGTAYGIVTDDDKTFLVNSGGTATVKIKFAAGATVTALLGDSVAFSHTEDAQCTLAAPASIAWVASGLGIRSKRTMKISGLNRPDCDGGGNREADLTMILAGVKGIDIGTLLTIAGVACADDYTVEQFSNDCLDEGCLTSNVTFTYDELPAFEGRSWELVPEAVTAGVGAKYGIMVTAGYVDIQFGNCSFDPTDYYEVMPVKMEISLLLEDGSSCDHRTLPTISQTRYGQISRASGEYIVREATAKLDAYQKDQDQFSLNPRMREAFDMNILQQVDRKAFYKLYYVTYYASYGTNTTFRKGEQQKFTTVFAIKESDPIAAQFESVILDVLSAKSADKIGLREIE